jgi:hypothetical protein
MGHVWTAPSWQGLSSRVQHWFCSACVWPRPQEAITHVASSGIARNVVPGSFFDQLQDTAQNKLRSFEPVIKHRTYGACARAILEDIKATAG